MEQEGRSYRVLEPLGRGGFGTVYRAELRGAGGFAKQVALKILNPEVVDSEDITRRLRDEARVLGLLRHRAIVQVDGLVQLSGRWTVVMEFVEGVDLRRIVAERGAMPVGPALEIIEEVASALAVAWQTKGADGQVLHLLHRDIKPGNIQLTRNAEVKVLDFGIAKAEFDSREAKTQGMMYGSLPYMAPERLEFTDLHEGDVYALGVTLTEMLTGQFWEKPSVTERKHEDRLAEVMASIAERTGEVEGFADLEALIRGMLAFEHEERFGADEVKRRAKTLQRYFGTPLLSEWSSEVVTALLATRPSLDDDDLSGSILLERDTAGHVVPVKAPAGTPAPAPAPDRPPAESSGGGRKAGLFAGLVLLALLGVTVVGVAVGGAVFLGMGDDGVAEAPEPEPEVVPAPAPEPEPDTAAVVVAPEPVPEPEPEPEPEPPPKPRPAPPAETRVELSGGATDVALVVGGKNVSLPAAVRPGTYEVQADFGRGLAPAGQVIIPKGKAVTLNCDAGFRLCALK